MRHLRRAFIAVVAATMAGCTSSSSTTSSVGPGVSPDQRFTNGAAEDVVVPPPPQFSNTDPCAMRLHDICGALLLYSLEHGSLPERLEDLGAMPGDTEQLTFECPVSHQPYVYSYEGIRIPSRKARVIIYDPAPSHSGYRWAVVIDEPQPDKPLVTDVRPFPESFFMLRPPGGNPAPSR